MGDKVQKPSRTSEDLREQQPLEEARDDISSFTCEICIEPVPFNMRFGFKNTGSKCFHHSYCLECIQKYIQSKIEEYNQAEIQCPGLECDELLDPLTCRSFLSKEVFVKWCDALCESTLSQYQKAYCPFLNCSALIVNECGGGFRKTKCPKCKNEFCFECKVPWHVGFTCNQIGPSDVLLHLLMEQKRWKRCPTCNHGVELISGCRMVKCRCATLFCHHCGKDCCCCEKVNTEELIRFMIMFILLLLYFPVILVILLLWKRLFRQE